MIEPDPEFERELDSILIGERQPGRVDLVEYDPTWPRRFDAVRDELAGALGPLAITIEHIGSTAVPQLAAKPIVDVLVTVVAIDPDDAYAAAIAPAGYELRVREPDHRMFRSLARDVHVHVWPVGHPEVERHLLFRDHLRASSPDRVLYEERKRELARRDWPDVNYYAAAKSQLIADILRRAREDDDGA